MKKLMCTKLLDTGTGEAKQNYHKAKKETNRVIKKGSKMVNGYIQLGRELEKMLMPNNRVLGLDRINS